MTSTGTSQFGNGDYIEEGTGYFIMGEAFGGYEFQFFDNVGFSLDAGYHYFTVGPLNANRNANTVRGAITQGSTLKNVDGTNRTVDLSGYFAAASLRIYIN